MPYIYIYALFDSINICVGGGFALGAVLAVVRNTRGVSAPYVYIWGVQNRICLVISQLKFVYTDWEMLAAHAQENFHFAALLHRRIGECIARRLEAQHHDVSRIRLGCPEKGIGAMEAIQDAQHAETVVESVGW